MRRLPESKSDSLNRFGGLGVTQPTSRGLNRFHGQKTALAAMSAARPCPSAQCRSSGGDSSSRGRLQSFHTVQQSVNAASVPFAATYRWYLSPVQLASDDPAGDKARFPKFTNCRTKGLSSRVRGLLDCQSIIDPAVLAGR